MYVIRWFNKITLTVIMRRKLTTRQASQYNIINNVVLVLFYFFYMHWRLLYVLKHWNSIRNSPYRLLSHHISIYDTKLFSSLKANALALVVWNENIYNKKRPSKLRAANHSLLHVKTRAWIRIESITNETTYIIHIESHATQ